MLGRWAQYMNSTSGVNDACIAANAGSEWKCIFAEHTSPHIVTPIFPLQGEYDSWRECRLKPCPASSLPCPLPCLAPACPAEVNRRGLC